MQVRNVLFASVPSLLLGIAGFFVGAGIDHHRKTEARRDQPKPPVGETWLEKLHALELENSQVGREQSERYEIAIQWGIGGTIVGLALGVIMAVRIKPGYVPVRKLGPVSFEDVGEASTDSAGRTS